MCLILWSVDTQWCDCVLVRGEGLRLAACSDGLSREWMQQSSKSLLSVDENSLDAGPLAPPECFLGNYLLSVFPFGRFSSNLVHDKFNNSFCVRL